MALVLVYLSIVCAVPTISDLLLSLTRSACVHHSRFRPAGGPGLDRHRAANTPFYLQKSVFASPSFPVANITDLAAVVFNWAYARFRHGTLAVAIGSASGAFDVRTAPLNIGAANLSIGPLTSESPLLPLPSSPSPEHSSTMRFPRSLCPEGRL
jgi:hypothetical protein